MTDTWGNDKQRRALVRLILRSLKRWYRLQAKAPLDWRETPVGFTVMVEGKSKAVLNLEDLESCEGTLRELATTGEGKTLGRVESALRHFHPRQRQRAH